jgi:hypothetical protein
MAEADDMRNITVFVPELLLQCRWRQDRDKSSVINMTSHMRNSGKRFPGKRLPEVYPKKERFVKG